MRLYPSFKTRDDSDDNEFNVPTAKQYTDKTEALKDVDIYHWVVIVKPTDSAGSKGVTRVDHPKNLLAAIDYAIEKSFSNELVIEDFHEKAGCSSDTDRFTVDGELKFVCFNAHHETVVIDLQR